MVVLGDFMSEQEKEKKVVEPDPIFTEITDSEKLQKEINKACCPLLLQFLKMTKEEFVAQCKFRAFTKEMPPYAGTYSFRNFLLITHPSLDYYLALDTNWFEDVTGVAKNTTTLGIMARFEVIDPDRPFIIFDQKPIPKIWWPTDEPWLLKKNLKKISFHFDSWLTYPNTDLLKFVTQLIT